MGEVDVKALAAGIANDIRTHGHYQGGSWNDLWGLDNPGGRCCVVVSPTYREAGDVAYEPLSRALGFWGVGALSHWNDHHPTADVLAALDGIAGQ